VLTPLWATRLCGGLAAATRVQASAQVTLNLSAVGSWPVDTNVGGPGSSGNRQRRAAQKVGKLEHRTREAVGVV